MLTSVFFSLLWQVSVYSLSFTGYQGASVSLSSFQGKKILIVNVATGSPLVGQLADLQTLQQREGDSLVIVAVPSHSFGHEPRNGGAAGAWIVNQYGATYRIAQTGAVTGADATSLFQWIAQIDQNGTMSNRVSGDFCKYLINEEGMLVAAFAPEVNPLSSEITDLLAD